MQLIPTQDAAPLAGTPAVPAAPATPAPAAAPGQPAPPAPIPTVALPNGDVLIPVVPRTGEELEGLRARREILRDQLERATNRREGLAAQLNRDPAPEARTGLEQRLQELDQRIIQIERDQALTERLISSAPASVLAQSEMARHEHSGVDEGEAVGAASAAFGAGVLLTIFLGRLRRRVAARRGVASTPLAAAEHERYDRLAQAVDAIALEVERIGEGQRFVTQLLADRREVPTLEAPRR